MLLLAFVLSAAPQSEPLAATPPPDRFDREHDRLLFETWGAHELSAGPFDPDPPPQAPPIRPTSWRVVAAEAGMEPSLTESVRLALDGFGDVPSREVELPEDGELKGAFRAARTTVYVEGDQIRFVRAPGAELVFVNGEGFIGDPDHRGWLGVPVALRAGANDVVAVSVADGFELELWRPITRLVMASWAPAIVASMPQPPDGWDVLAMPIFNAAATEAGSVHFHYDHARNVGEEPDLSEFWDGGFAVPLGLVKSQCYPFSPGDVPSGPEVLLPLATYHHGDAMGERRLLQLRMDQNGPSWPRPVTMRWPPMREGSAAPIAERRNGLIVVEGSVDPDLSRELLAVGRFLQQRLWERAGVLPAVHTAEHEVTESGASRRERANWVVRVGLLERDLRAGDSLWAGPEGGAFALRGSSPSGLQLAYSIEPFFQDVPLAGRTWSVD